MMSNKKIKIILIKSTIGSQKDQIATVKGLGLRKLNSSVIRETTPETMGMIKKVNHLIITEEQ
jgi:large subunit ribosomal protein L30